MLANYLWAELCIRLGQPYRLLPEYLVSSTIRIVPIFYGIKTLTIFMFATIGAAVLDSHLGTHSLPDDSIGDSCQKTHLLHGD